MNNRKKAAIITACGCLLLLLIAVAVPFAKNYLMNLGFIHFSEKEVVSLFEENKKDFQIAADYTLCQCKYYAENTTVSSDKEIKKGELIEAITLYYCYEGYYGATIKNKGDDLRNKIIKPYDLSAEAKRSFDNLRKKNFSGAIVDETQNKSVYVKFPAPGGGIFDHQCIAYFKDKEHDLKFSPDYKAVPLSEEGWYYLTLGTQKIGNEQLFHLKHDNL